MSGADGPAAFQASATRRSDSALARPSSAIVAACARRLQRGRLAVDLRRDDHLGLQAHRLQLAAHRLQRLLGGGARRQRRPARRAPRRSSPRPPARPTIRRSSLRFCTIAALGVGLGHLGAHLGGGRLLGRLVARVRLGDLGVAHHVRDPLAADRRQVVRVVGDVLDLQHVQVQAQLGQILLDLRRQRVGELQAVLVHLLGRQRREHAAQVALQRLLRHLLDVAHAAPEEALDRVHHHRRIRRQLDDRDRPAPSAGCRPSCTRPAPTRRSASPASACAGRSR